MIEAVGMVAQPGMDLLLAAGERHGGISLWKVHTRC
jgi:hypothetical protein